jgi:hypothetical protein
MICLFGEPVEEPSSDAIQGELSHGTVERSIPLLPLILRYSFAALAVGIAPALASLPR